MKYQIYEKYVDSQIDWLGEIPDHWKVTKLKHISNIVLGKMLTPNDSGVSHKKPYLRAQNIGWLRPNVDDVKDMWFNDIELLKYRVRENELLVSEGGEVGRTCIWSNELNEVYIQNSVNKVEITAGNPRFYLYHFFAFGQRGFFDSVINRVSIGHLTREKLKEVFIIYPPLPEQRSIAAFLDRETARIDALIDKKQQLIALLKEKRTALITRAVTRGLDANAKMKDSGIEWLGDIPEHWEVKRLKYLGSVRTGRTPDIQNSKIDFFENGDYNWFTPSDFGENDILKNSNRKINQKALMNHEVEVFPEYAVYLVSIGATLGKVGYCEKQATANQQINIISFNKQVLNPIFGYYYLYAIKEILIREADHTTLAILNQTKAKKLLIAVPSMEEQNIIASYLQENCLKLEHLSDKIKTSIIKYQEYRTALISAAVTGKIKVE
jgi:type I restriction enzyme, S subunit